MLDRYAEALKSRGLAPRTVITYLSILRNFKTWWEGITGEPFTLNAVTSLDIADYRRYLLNQNRKPATINLHLDAVSSFFYWAISEGIVSSNPVQGVRRVPEQRKVPRWLSRTELGSLVRALKKYGKARDMAFLALLLHAGLRVSEAVALRTEDLVLRERSGLIRVRRGKGEKWREVPLNATARRMLAEYLAGHRGGEWLFPGRGGGHITARAMQKRLAELGRLAGVEVTPHRLRHTFCKMLVDAGESLDRVAMLAGHSNLNTTARYTRPSVQDLEKAVEKLAWE